MAQIRGKTKEIRDYIIANVAGHRPNIVALTCDQFDISRQAAARHVRWLVDEGVLQAEGTTRNRVYRLAVIDGWEFEYNLSETTSEADVWLRDIKSVFDGLPENVIDIWYTGFTEMFNNVIDHSCSETVGVSIEKTAIDFDVVISDRGVGIFKKIKDALDLADERHAALELAKGKFTTDPVNHTGMGIFFSYHAFDKFTLISGNVYFSHDHDNNESWIVEDREYQQGTDVFLKLNNDTKRTMLAVYDSFTSDAKDDHAFNRTIIPVKLAEYGDDKLVSRSQAKRVLVRVDKFETVYFDFSGVEHIGQAFADEIFRVFQNKHHNMEILAVNANSVVSRMISMAVSGG